MCCNLWDDAATKKVAEIVNNEWKMKRFTVAKNTGKTRPNKDAAPHFNGPECDIVLQNRDVVLIRGIVRLNPT